jgi:uncharacterized membrane-anchored protein
MIATNANVIGIAVFVGVALGAGIVLLTLYITRERGTYR